MTRQRPMTARRAFGTVVTKNYLPYARVLADSIRRFHPDPIYVVSVDGWEGCPDAAGEPFTRLSLDDLVPPADDAMRFYYTAFELCNAARAYLHQFLLNRTDADAWLYIDADVLVTAPLDDAFERMAAPVTGLVSPHVLEPCDGRIAEPVETSLQRFGIYNSGFLAMRRSPEATAFIAWFADRLRTLCFFMEHDVNCDQLWLNFVPLYFSAIDTWRHPGANVAYWNLHERTLTRSPAGYLANGEPLLFLHFSRWRYDAPDDWTFGRRTTPGTDRSIISESGIAYRDALAAAGHDAYRGLSYGFGTFADGRPITKPMRRRYYEMFKDGTADAGSPFDHPEWFPTNKAADAVKKMLPQRLKDFIRSMIS